MKNKQVTKRPNVIWVFGDQHRAQALSCSGDPNVSTPTIDTLATQGVTFTQAVSGFPLCCPYRASLLTSRYPHQCVNGNEQLMDPRFPTIATAFRDAGYGTAYFGKWHVDGFHESQGRAAMHIIQPERRGGFDTWVGYENNNSQWDSWVHGGAGGDAFHYRLPGYETDALTDLFVSHIEAQAKAQDTGTGKPFFAALSVQPPHGPYVAPRQFKERHNPATITLRPNVPRGGACEERARRDLAGYYAMIENLDWNVGRIMDALDRLGLRFTTHVLFFSDHGDMHGSHGLHGKSVPFEESIRTPFVIAGENPHWYDGRKAGRCPVPINHVDVAPTTLGLCGIPTPSWMRGVDYSHYRIDKKPCPDEPDSAYLQFTPSTPTGDAPNKAWRGIVTRDGWKYACFENCSWLMFNLNEDPFEQANLAHANKHRVQRGKLIDRLRQWVADTGDSFQVPEL